MAGLVFVAGCRSSESTVLADEDYGPFPDNYRELAKAYLAKELVPDAAPRFRFSRPIQGYIRGIPAEGGKILDVGWVVVVGLSWKESSGGYTKDKLHRLLIREGAVRSRFAATCGSASHG